MTTIVTVGVYGWTLDRFLAALAGAGVRLLLDVRQRRGVRGPEYVWANARRLEASVASSGIEYRHVPQLAPTTGLRQELRRHDERSGVRQRTRAELPPWYVERYTREVLDRADLGAVAAALPADGAAAVFCVERDPEACHRSLVAARLAGDLGLRVLHLRPG